MKITIQQLNELVEKAKPLNEWLADNANPHCSITIACGFITLNEGIASSAFPPTLADKEYTKKVFKLSKFKQQDINGSNKS